MNDWTPTPPLRSSLLRSDLLLDRLRLAPDLERIERPNAGDVVACTVLDTNGPYCSIETGPVGRDEPLAVGTQILAVIGDRDSSVNPTGFVPQRSLGAGDVLDLLSAAGLVGVAEFIPRTQGGRAMTLRFDGAFADANRQPINLRNFAPFRDEGSCPSAIHWIGVCGSAAEVGKTTLVERLLQASLRLTRKPVGAAKLSGTGRLRDPLRMARAGASWTADFVDAGFETTYRASQPEMVRLLRRISAAASKQSTELIVAELGGDILEAGVPHLLPLLSDVGARFAFVAHDAMGAAYAQQRMAEAEVAFVARSTNVCAIARRLEVDRVYDVDDPVDVDDLYLWLSKSRCR